MNPLDWIMKGRFAAAAKAGAGFVTVSIVGAVGLVVVAIVLWAASLTPFGLWAGVPVIAAGVATALVLWRQGRAGTPAQPAMLELQTPLSWPNNDRPEEVVRQPRFKLMGSPAPPVPRLARPVAKEPGAQSVDDLKRNFDQAFAAGRFDEAERMLAELTNRPGQADWAQRKQRLVRQQRARS